MVDGGGPPDRDALGARSTGTRPSTATRVGAPTVATFYSPDALVAGASITLGDDAAHHMRVRRMETGDAIALRDGVGRAGHGRLVRLAKSHAVVELASVHEIGPPPALHLLAPVADRERMLLVAEKSVELGIASWRPVSWRRSRSVGTRGEGAGFQAKVRARMTAALVQSEAAWLPELHPDAPLDRALLALPESTRLLLDPDGASFDEIDASGAVTLAVGPEGGLEPDEVAALAREGFRPVRIPGNILRFETAAIVGVAFARAALDRAARRRATT